MDFGPRFGKLAASGNSEMQRCRFRREATLSGSHSLLVVTSVGADEWIAGEVDPVAPIETVQEQPWASVWRVPTAKGVLWFKACAPVQAFEPRLTADLFVCLGRPLDRRGSITTLGRRRRGPSPKMLDLSSPRRPGSPLSGP